MAKERKYFGTDGVRGKVGQYPITPDFVLKLGWAAGKVLSKGKRGKVLIGKDTRISGYMFESALEAGLSAAGVDIRLLGPMPTPAIAYLTRTFRAEAGIVISASHNPYDDNGIKFFSSDGVKLPDEVELAIEEQLDQPLVTVESAELGKASRIVDAAGRYIEFCKSTFSENGGLSGLKIVVDCAHGAAYHVAPAIFRELGATVVAIGVHPDGLNINEESGSTETSYLKKMVLFEEADLGVALDGDGDRLIMVDHTGTELDGDELLYIIVKYWHETGRLKGGVVGTVMSNLGLELALQKLDILFARTPVGDRYVIAELNQRGWQLGGEASGHIICTNLMTTGDGIIAALQVLSAFMREGVSLHQLKKGLTKLPQSLLNVAVPSHVESLEFPGIQQAVALAEASLGKYGRVLLRPSGTESIVRVMVEGDDAMKVQSLAESLACAVEATFNSV